MNAISRLEKKYYKRWVVFRQCAVSLFFGIQQILYAMKLKTNIEI